MAGNASGQEIVEELDALAALTGSPTAGDGDHFRSRNPMSPTSTDWSRALGWAGGSPFQVPFDRAAVEVQSLQSSIGCGDCHQL